MEDREFIGMTLVEAGRRSAEIGIRIRPVKIDGQSLMVTCDWCIDRLNVEVEKDRIVSITGRG